MFTLLQESQRGPISLNEPHPQKPGPQCLYRKNKGDYVMFDFLNQLVGTHARYSLCIHHIERGYLVSIKYLIDMH